MPLKLKQVAYCTVSSLSQLCDCESNTVSQKSKPPSFYHNVKGVTLTTAEICYLQESPAVAKVSARQQCVYEGP